MTDTYTTNFNITKPQAGKNNWDVDYAALCDLIDSRLALRFRNLIVNGAFDIWQRGTSFAAIAAGLYSADRFEMYRSAFALGATLSRQSSSGIVRSEYVARLQRDSGNSTTDALCLSSALKSSNSRHLAGQSVTLSLKLRKGANYSGGDVSFKIVNGTGTDEGLGGVNFTGHNELATGLAATTTDFQIFQVSGTVPSSATQLGIILSYTPTGTAGADDWIEIAEMQLEEGSVATAFEYRDDGLELWFCQSYYEKSYNRDTSPGTVTNLGKESVAAHSLTGYFRHSSQFKTRKRVVPTVTTYSTGTGLAGKLWVANTLDVAPSLEDIGETGFSFYHNRTWDPSDFIWWHWTADAEL